MAKEGNDTSASDTTPIQLQPLSSLRILELVHGRSNAEEWGAWLQVPLHHAAAVGDKELTTELMLAGASGSPLLEAVKGGHDDLVEHLVVLQGQSPHIADEEGSQAIHHAARLGHELTVSILLKHGAGAAPLDGRGLTPLLLAAREGHAGVVEILLDAGADARARGEVGGFHQLPLDLAAGGGHIDVISGITRRDPEIVNDTESTTGKASLHHAAMRNQVASIDALVKAGANLEIRDTYMNTALHFAAAECEDAVLALLRHGAEKEILNVDNLTPLLVAIKAGCKPTAMALIAAGADCNGGAHSFSILELAAEGGCVELLRLLVERGASPSEVENGGYTCLHTAAWYDNAPAIDFLVESGANLESKLDDTGETPFHAAVRNAGNLAAIAALVRHGANIHARKVPSGDTPLHVAARNCFFRDSPETVDALLRAGADETAVNTTGQTPADMIENIVDESGSTKHAELTLALLTSAPRDRADRRWARRRLFVLCHALSDRVRLASPEDGARDCSPAFGVIGPTISATKRVAREVCRGGLGNHGEATCNPLDGTVGISGVFSDAMGKLIELQADVFRTVVKFL